MWKRLIGWAVGVVALTGWIALLTPPVTFLQNHSLNELFFQLTRIENQVYENSMFLGWAFIALSFITSISTIAFVRSVIKYLEVSFSNISVLESHIRLEIVDDAFTISRASRKQHFHANRKGISAYKFESRMDSPNGKISRKSIQVSSSIGKDPISSSKPTIWGTDRYIEVMETYKSPLPTSLFASILPNWATHLIWRAGLLNKVVVTRSSYAEYKNEHNSKLASMAIKAGNRIGKLKITVEFPEITAPEDRHVECMLVEENVVSAIGYTRRHERGRVVLEMELSNFWDHEFRIQWKNRKLKRHLDSLAARSSP